MDVAIGGGANGKGTPVLVLGGAVGWLKRGLLLAYELLSLLLKVGQLVRHLLEHLVLTDLGAKVEVTHDVSAFFGERFNTKDPNRSQQVVKLVIHTLVERVVHYSDAVEYSCV